VNALLSPVTAKRRRLRCEIPMLMIGDRLSATEFLRRWEAMPEVKNAELINGIVHTA